MTKHYADGEGFKKTLAAKNKKKNRKIRKTYTQHASNRSQDSSELVDCWAEFDDVEFEKFNKRRK